MLDYEFHVEVFRRFVTCLAAGYHSGICVTQYKFSDGTLFHFCLLCFHKKLVFLETSWTDKKGLKTVKHHVEQKKKKVFFENL